MPILASIGHRARSDPHHTRPNSEALPLALGFALGSALVVAWLGLRGPVLVSAVVPPLAAAGYWQRRRTGANDLFLANRSAEANSILEAGGLQKRLNQLCENPAGNAMWRWRWEGLVRQMQSIRSLAASCVALAPDSAVPLLVYLEELLDRIEPVGRMIKQLDLHSPSPLSGSYGLVNGSMEELQNHLSSSIRRMQDIHDKALEQSMRHPDEPIDFQQLLSQPL
jgi:hypothetical protein